MEQRDENTYELDIKGERVEMSSISPSAKINRWDGESSLSLAFPLTGSVGFTVSDTTVRHESRNAIVELYEKGGRFEFEIMLLRRPRTNRIPLNINLGNVIAYPQPPLTPFEIEQGFSRPENVIDSWAFYKIGAKNIYTSREESLKYRVGKVGHLYRIHAEDDNRDGSWARLLLLNGQYFIVFDNDFIQSARYPIVIDPTFGWETQGATPIALENDHVASRFTATGGDGTGDRISIYLNVTSEAHLVKCMLYGDGDGEADLSAIPAIANGITDETDVGVSETWNDFSFAVAPSITNNTPYRPSGWAENESGSCEAYYDTTIAGAYAYRLTNNVYNGFPNPITFGEGFNDYRLSIHIDYTLSAGWSNIAKVSGVTEANLGKMNTVDKANIAKIMGVAV